MCYWPSVKSKWLDVGLVPSCIFLDQDEHDKANIQSSWLNRLIQYNIDDLSYHQNKIFLAGTKQLSGLNGPISSCWGSQSERKGQFNKTLTSVIYKHSRP